MNKALLEQLALAEQAGEEQEAKDFFAKPQNAAEAPPGEGEASVAMEAEGEMTPEQLEELLAMLGNGE